MVATYQERFATYLQKTLQRRCWSGSLRSNPCSIPVPDPYHSDLESFTFCCETVECVRIFPFFCNRKARRARRARGARGARGERLASHLTEMLRRTGTSLPVCAQEQERYYPTPPHPSVTDHERAVQRVCLQDSKKDDEVAVPDSMSQPRAPKCYPKGMILWCSKWSTFFGALSDPMVL